MRRLRLASVFGLALGIASVGRAEAPRTVCSVTLHSEDEIALLRARLPQDEFHFVELTKLGELTELGEPTERGEEEADAGDWLGAACRSGVRCDVLVVSGHFGGSFFGDSGRTLSLADLEAHACRDDCSGILAEPTEVFLLGCNTAASKERDHRSPDEYLRVLREDGIPRRSAERIVESRYGALGNSFRARMERVFAGVPRLYGFASVAPAGPTAAAALERYLGLIESSRLGAGGGYAAHLERMASRDGPAANRALARAFAHTTFVESAGMSADGEAAAGRELVCSLYDEARPAEERLGVVETMAQDPAFLAYVPSIERFFDDHPRWSLQGPRAEAALERLAGLTGARAALLERLETLGAPTLRSELADVAASLGWIDDARHRRIAREAVVDLLDRHMGLEEQSAICELAPALGAPDLRADEIDPQVFVGEPARHAARALLCVEPRDPALRRHMTLALHDERWGVRARALETLSRLGVDVHAFEGMTFGRKAAQLLASDPRAEVRAEAARALAARAGTPGAVAALSAALSDDDPAVRAVAARGLGELGGHAGVATRLASALADDDWQVQFAAAAALDRIAQSSVGFGDPAVAAGVERALEQALDAPSWFVRYKVAEILARI